MPHRPPGWDYWFAETNVAPYDFAVLNNDGEVIEYGSAPEDYEADVMAAEAVRQIAATADDPQPLFMVVSPFSPHYPHVPPTSAMRGPTTTLPCRCRQTSTNPTSATSRPGASRR